MADTRKSALHTIRVVLWTLVGVVAIGAIALYFTRPAGAPLAVTGTPFAMQATTGGTFTQNDLRGRPSLVFFGFTNCPDVCPTTLAEIRSWREALDLTPDELRTIFVTVDPQRDTLSGVQGYLAGWDNTTIGLVGDEAQTEAAKAAFGVMSERVGDDPDYYNVNHTASVFLVDANGRFAGTIAWEESAETAIAKIERLLET